MSRSNGPMVPPGGVPPRPPRLQQSAPPPPPGFGPAPAQASSEQLSQVSYRQPLPQQTRGPQGFPQPQFDPFATQQQPYPAAPLPTPGLPAGGPYGAAPGNYAATHGYEQPVYQGQPPPYPQPGPSAAASRTAAPAFDQWSQPTLAPDAHGYEHGGYPPVQPDHGYQHDPAYGQPGLPHVEALGYPQVDSAGAPTLQVPSDWSHDPQYNPQPGYEPTLDTAGYRADQHGYQQGQPAPQEHAGEYEDDEYDVEESPRGNWMRIAAALVGAIVIGGGLALAYTQLMTGDSSKPQLIKNEEGPSKVKPADAGGKKIRHADNKIEGRLVDQPIAASEGDASGVKKVATVKIGADGSIVPPADAPAEAAPAAAATDSAGAAPPAVAASDDGGFPSAGATYAAPAPADAKAAADGPLTITPPKIIEKVGEKATAKVAAAAIEAAPGVSQTTTNSINAAGNAAKPAAQAPPPAKKAAAPAPAVSTGAAPAPKKQAVAAVTSPGSTGAGYVAVVASVPVSNTSRINALKQFADMQQKYGTVLQNKAPEVKEANLGEKGNYHRLLVGPPGSREGAQALCGSLKQAGYAESCWVTAY